MFFPLKLIVNIIINMHCDHLVRWKFNLSQSDADRLKDLAEDVDMQSHSVNKELLSKNEKEKEREKLQRESRRKDIDY